MPSIDLFLIAAEPSADLHGASLIKALLAEKPDLRIAAIAGPLMRKLPIQTYFAMEQFQVMGFIDVLKAFPKLARLFFQVKKTILSLDPKAVVSIDYPGFNLRLAASLKNRGFKGKWVHYICPSVWAWGKGRIPKMAKTLDLLLTLFPFEKPFFASTSLPVEYTGHPLVSQIPKNGCRVGKQSSLLAIFPGSRKAEIKKNLPLQLAAAEILAKQIPSLRIGISIAHVALSPLIHALSSRYSHLHFYEPDQKYDLMRQAKMAIATSGTVNLELALHNVPTIVNFAIRPLDQFIAQTIFRIDLPFYCIVNIIVSKQIFPEFFGSKLTLNALASEAYALWTQEEKYAACEEGCLAVRDAFGVNKGPQAAAKQILTKVG